MATALQAFLNPIELSSWDAMLVKLGYDKVEDFAKFDDAKLACMRAALRQEVEAHIEAIVGAVKQRSACSMEVNIAHLETPSVTPSNVSSSADAAAMSMDTTGDEGVAPPAAAPPDAAPAAVASSAAVPSPAVQGADSGGETPDSEATAAMVRAAIAAAASPIQLQLEKLEEDYDEETVDAQAAQFTQAFIQFAAANPGAAGASAAAVLLIQALSLVAARMEEADDEDDDEGYDDDDDDDDIADYGDYDDDAWRP